MPMSIRMWKMPTTRRKRLPTTPTATDTEDTTATDTPAADNAAEGDAPAADAPADDF